MKFWIVTPSYNQVDWLKLCVASVRDQVSDDALNGFNGSGTLSVHHHIQDACSTDGTVEFLKEYVAKHPSTENYQLSFASEADEGMYDAINKGWRCAAEDAEVIAYLNCDEQYLPGGLASVAGVFREEVATDIVLAGNIVVDANGKYLCHRRAVRPYLWSSKFWTASSPVSTFLRRSVFFDKDGTFDCRWSVVGDLVWYTNLLSKGLTISLSTDITSVCCDAGDNLALSARGREELQHYRTQILGKRAWLSGPVKKLNTIRRILADMPLKKPQEYAIYQGGEQREIFSIEHPTNLWKR